MATAFVSDLKSNTRKEMIDLVNARMRDHIDVIAERCVILGGDADGTSQTVAEKST